MKTFLKIKVISGIIIILAIIATVIVDLSVDLGFYNRVITFLVVIYGVVLVALLEAIQKTFFAPNKKDKDEEESDSKVE